MQKPKSKRRELTSKEKSICDSVRSELGTYAKANRLSQELIAEKLGCTRAALNQWMNAVKPVPRHRLQQIADFLNISMRLLDPNCTEREAATLADLEFLEVLRQNDERGKQLVLKIAEEQADYTAKSANDETN